MSIIFLSINDTEEYMLLTIALPASKWIISFNINEATLMPFNNNQDIRVNTG
jgi:hypothetical protein